MHLLFIIIMYIYHTPDTNIKQDIKWKNKTY